jgi:antitoxin Phd
MTKTVSIAEARHDLAALVHRAETGETVEVTRRGKAVAVMISAEEYRRLNRSKSQNFFSAVMAWREKYADELSVEDAGFDPFADIRDKSPGRDSPDFNGH